MRPVSQSSLCAAIAVFCAFSFSSTPAKADIETIRGSDNSFWGSMGSSFFNYKESTSATGQIPDSQHGLLPSFAAGVNYMGDNNNIYFALDGSLSLGKDLYKGAIYDKITSSYDVPYETITRETITAIDGKIGKGFAFWDSVMITPYVDIGFRYWDRNLGDGSSEDYDNFDALGGAMAQFSPLDRLTLSAYGATGLTFAGRMETAGTTFNLGSAGVYKLGGKIGYNLTQHVELFTSLDYDHFHYVKSGVEQITPWEYAFEPSSATSDTAVRLGLAYHFR
jgi:hypothetical protein